jgi:hypothetical protein
MSGPTAEYALVPGIARLLNDYPRLIANDNKFLKFNGFCWRDNRLVMLMLGVFDLIPNNLV